MDSVRAADPGYGQGGGRTYVRDPKGSETGGQFTANPAPVTGTYKGYKAGGAVSHGTGGTKKSGARKPDPKAGLPASSRFKTLTPGGDNDPQAVKEMQQLLTALGFGNVTASGVYDAETDGAVREVQRRLGVKKPNGEANRALVSKMLTAYDLSPCVKR